MYSLFNDIPQTRFTSNLNIRNCWAIESIQPWAMGLLRFMILQPEGLFPPSRLRIAPAISRLRSATVSLSAATDASVDLSLVGWVKYVSLTLTVFCVPSIILQRPHSSTSWLRVGLEAEHFHLHLIGGLSASWPWVSDNSVGLKQD